MNAKGKKFIALFLVFSLFALSGNLFAKERRGADLIIQKQDGTQVRGELIAVKQNSLLLKDSISGTDMSVDISDIKVIKIVKKSKAWWGAFVGYLIGFASSHILYANDPGDEGFSMGRGFLYAQITAAPGALIGGGFGAVAGKDKTIRIEGKSDSEIKQALEKLRSKARIPDYK